MKEQDLLDLGFTRNEDPTFNGPGERPLVYFSKGDFLSNTEEEAEQNNGNYNVQLLGSEYDYKITILQDLKDLFTILDRAEKTKNEFDFNMDGFNY